MRTGGGPAGDRGPDGGSGPGGSLGDAAVPRGVSAVVTRIAVLTGGSTAERDVAFAGAAQVVAALRSREYDVAVVDSVNGFLSDADESRYLVPSVGREPPRARERAALRGPALGPAVALARRYDDEVILERYLPGREFTVGVLGDRALAVGEIIPSHEIFDYECKYTPGMSREIFPADVGVELAARIQILALMAHRTLKLRDFSRVDFRLGADGVPYCLEANTLPGVTRTSLFPQSAAAVGIDFASVCQTICDLALRRARFRNNVRA